MNSGQKKKVLFLQIIHSYVRNALKMIESRSDVFKPSNAVAAHLSPLFSAAFHKNALSADVLHIDAANISATVVVVVTATIVTIEVIAKAMTIPQIATSAA